VGGDRQSFEFPAIWLPGSFSGTTSREALGVRRVGFHHRQIDLNGPNRELTDELVP